jgi:hypothetical protein
MQPQFCTDAEVDDICAGLTQSAAKCRFLREVLQIPVKRKPNGRPLVLRADLDRARPPVDDLGSSTGAASNEPKWLRKVSR